VFLAGATPRIVKLESLTEKVFPASGKNPDRRTRRLDQVSDTPGYRSGNGKMLMIAGR
jgi:hypothetical protein